MPSTWVLNYRTGKGMMDDDDSDSDTEPVAPSSEDSLQVDISSRDETVVYKPNPFSIAKINAGVRKNQPPPKNPALKQNSDPPKPSTSSVLHPPKATTVTATQTKSVPVDTRRQTQPSASASSTIQTRFPNSRSSVRPAQPSSHPAVAAPSRLNYTSGSPLNHTIVGSEPAPAHRIAATPRRAAPPNVPARIYPIPNPSPRPSWVDAPSSSPEPAAIFQPSSQGRQTSTHTQNSEFQRFSTSHASRPSFFAPRLTARPNAVSVASAPALPASTRFASLTRAPPLASKSPALHTFSSPARPTYSPAPHPSSPLNPSTQPSSLQRPVQSQSRPTQRIYEPDRPAWIDGSSSPDPAGPPTPPRKRPVASVYDKEDEQWGTLPSKKPKLTPLGLTPKSQGRLSASQGRLSASQGRLSASQGRPSASQARSTDKRATFTLPGLSKPSSRLVTYMPPPPDPKKQPALAAVSVYRPPSPPKSDPSSDPASMTDDNSPPTPQDFMCDADVVAIDVEATARAYRRLPEPLGMCDILPGLDSCGAVWEEEDMPAEMGIPVWRGRPTTFGLDPLLVTVAL